MLKNVAIALRAVRFAQAVAGDVELLALDAGPRIGLEAKVGREIAHGVAQHHVAEFCVAIRSVREQRQFQGRRVQKRPERADPRLVVV